MRAERTHAIAPDRAAKDDLHAQFARIGRALANPHRVELLDLLAQGERSVEVLATRASISVGLASAHLQALRRAGLVVSRRDGTRIVYRLAGDDVYELLTAVRAVATGADCRRRAGRSRVHGRTGRDGEPGRVAGARPFW